jgi:excisionase family DNA binding protein
VTCTQISRRHKGMTTGMTALSDRPIAVSVGRAAVLVGVSKATIRSFARTGRLRVARMGRRIVVPMNSLEQLVRDSTT